MSAVCPSCLREQDAGLLCSACCDVLERELGDVAAIIGDLDVTRSKQARIGSGAKGGLASERTPVGWGAVDPRWVLENVLTTWIRDVTGEGWQPGLGANPTQAAAAHLMMEMNAIRRHPAVDKLVDEVLDAIRNARRAVDRPAERQYLGQCLVPTPDDEGREVTCLAHLYARQGAVEVTCECGITHEVEDRRGWLLDQARDLLFSVQEAAQVIGSYGHLQIRESTIRNYVSTNQLVYHGKVGGCSVIRLGDLLDVIARHAAKPHGRKLRPAV